MIKYGFDLAFYFSSKVKFSFLGAIKRNNAVSSWKIKMASSLLFGFGLDGRFFKDFVYK
jgi:hypothetical protein